MPDWRTTLTRDLAGALQVLPSNQRKSLQAGLVIGRAKELTA